MSDEPGSINRTQLLVALIGLASAVTVAVIANADKLFHREAPAPVTADAAPPPATVAPNVAGNWRDDEGYDYVFTQQGASYGYRMLRAGEQLSSGSGQIAGRHLKHGFDSPDGAGTCDAELSAAGDIIAGTCARGGQTWPFSIRRS